MRDLVSDKVVQQLAGARNYREFIKMILTAYQQHYGRGASALLARQAGYGSRSYISELISGKKGLSRDALMRLRKAFKLRGPLARLFENLAALEHPEVQLKPMSTADRTRKIQALRQEVAASVEKVLPELQLSSPEVFQVYAALGTEQHGATLAEVTLRTRVAPRQVRESLSKLIAIGVVQAAGARYYPITAKADRLRAKNGEALAEMVRIVCANIQTKRVQILADKRSAVAYTAFSLRRDRLPDLKRALEEAVFDVIDDFQDDSGDGVAQIFFSLFNAPLSPK